jgi:hypothetical protein
MELPGAEHFATVHAQPQAHIHTYVSQNQREDSAATENSWHTVFREGMGLSDWAVLAQHVYEASLTYVLSSTQAPVAGQMLPSLMHIMLHT